MSFRRKWKKSQLSLDFPSLELRGLAQTIKKSPRPLFLLHQTLQLALYIGPGRVMLASSKPRLVHRTAMWWSVIHHSSKGIFTAPESNGGGFTPLQPILGIAHGGLRLVCSCLAMETHFMKLPTNSYFADVTSTGSLELGSECCNRGQAMFTRYRLQHSSLSLSLCGLPLCGCAIVEPRHLHFTITALTFDWGSSIRA